MANSGGDSGCGAVNSGSGTGSGGGITSGTVISVLATGSELSKMFLDHPRLMGFDSTDGKKDIENHVSRGVKPYVLQGAIAMMNAGWNLHVSAVRSDHPSQDGGPNGHGHNAGRALDFNNYGAGGRGGTAGTSSTDPTAFIKFLTDNRIMLGGIHVGYGSGSPQAGADFPDRTDHVHVQWDN